MEKNEKGNNKKNLITNALAIFAILLSCSACDRATDEQKLQRLQEIRQRQERRQELLKEQIEELKREIREGNIIELMTLQEISRLQEIRQWQAMRHIKIQDIEQEPRQRPEQKIQHEVPFGSAVATGAGLAVGKTVANVGLGLAGDFISGFLD